MDLSWLPMHGFREVEAMPIYLLGPLVVCGIILVVILVRALFNQRPRELSDRRDIETLFLMDFPKAVIAEPVLIGSNRRSAIFALEGEEKRFGLMRGMGNHWLTRMLTGHGVTAINRAGELQVEIRMDDFTLPRTAIRFDTSEMADRRENELNAMMWSD